MDTFLIYKIISSLSFSPCILLLFLYPFQHFFKTFPTDTCWRYARLCSRINLFLVILSAKKMLPSITCENKECMKWRKSGYAIPIAPILVLHKWMSLLQITIWTRATTYYARGYSKTAKKSRLTVTLHFKGQFAFFTLTRSTQKSVTFYFMFAIMVAGFSLHISLLLLLLKQKA